MQDVYRLCSWLLLLAILCSGALVAQEQDFAGAWAKVLKLENEHKYAAALENVIQIYRDAAAQDNYPQWTKALTRTVALERALHGYETAVRFLLQEKWPSDPVHESLVRIFYAMSLMDYYSNYAWEINEREKVVSEKGVDLKQWTAFDIFEAAHEQYALAYQNRELLGGLKVADYPDYVQRQGCPENIRATLRDFLAYQWVEFLGNTTTWRPQELKEKYKLDFAALSGAPETRSPADLGKEAHPLTRLVSILDELYLWHTKNDNPESALESQLERVRRIAAVFEDPEQTDVLIAALRQILPRFEAHPWWAAGQAELAAMLQKRGDLVAAHEAALLGHDRYPESLGGERCMYLVKSIEAPDFNIYSMNIDRLQARSIEVSHKNLAKLHFRAYQLDFNQWMNRKYRYLGGIDSKEVRDIVHTTSPSLNWEVDLPDLGDFRVHKTYVTPPLTRSGFYLIAGSAQSDFKAARSNRIDAVYFLATSLAMTVTSIESECEVRVVDGNTGRPVADAQVALYYYEYEKPPRKMHELTTDGEGYVHFQRLSDRYSYYPLATKDGEISFDTNAFYSYQPSREKRQRGCFIYTDRSIYRPLQKVLFKVVTYQGKSGDYQGVPDRPVTTVLYDANGKEIATVTGTTNTYGTASGEFTIPAGRVLGHYRLQASMDNGYGATYFRVEEYKRPTFEVSLKKPDKQLKLNERVSVAGEARYYFGLPVATGKVFYRVTREPVWPFWYWWYYGSASETRHTYEIAAGTTTLKDDGTFAVEFTPEADPSLSRDPEMSYNFRVEAEVTDEGGETRPSSCVYPIGFVAVRAELEFASSFFTAREQTVVDIGLSDLSGVPQTGEGEYRLVNLASEKVLFPENLPVATAEGIKTTEGDRMRPRWESDKPLEQYLFYLQDQNEIARGALQHGKNGKATLSLGNLDPGIYRLYYGTKDAWGAEYRTRRDFIVAGKGCKIPVPSLLLAKKAYLAVGESAVILVGSGIEDQPYWFEIYQENKLIKRELRQGGTAEIVEMEIEATHRGGFSVAMFAVHDYRLYEPRQDIQVPWDNKHLEVSFKTFRDTLRPGQKETWTVSVRGPKSEIVAAELLAYMYDRSLDFFAPHHYPSLDGLLPHKCGIPGTRINVSQSYFSSIWNKLYSLPPWPHYGPDRVNLLSGYGIGGLGRRKYNLHGDAGALAEMDSTPSARLEATGKSVPAAPEEKEKAPEKPAPAPKAPAEESTQVRTQFQETAFFYPHLTTDKDGEVNIEFEVPDSVTSWNVYLHAMTKDIRFMTLQKETATRKDLMVRPYLPRFLREGDAAVLKVVVNNATDAPMSGKVTLSIFDPETNQDRSREFGVTQTTLPWKAEGKKGTNLSWNMKVPPALGLYHVKVVAKSDTFSDGELRPLPILPGRVHLSQSKFVTVKENQTRTLHLADLERAGEDPTLIHDSLVVTLDAQLFYAVLKAIPYLTNYPYECVEQTLNRFLCAGILTSFYDEYPALSKLAKEFSQRKTELDPWKKDDPNRKMALEETPWLMPAEGGETDMSRLINVLDPEIAKMQRESALEKLQKAQFSNGAFPWFPGGPPSPYMTLYLVHGFAKAEEFNVPLPNEMAPRAFGYLADHFRDYYAQKMLIEDYGYEFITFLNYVISCFKDDSNYGGSFTADDRKRMLEFSFKHWKGHSPYLKAYLALTLHRMDRPQDARLVFDSIMDSAVTREDEGTFWAREDRSWLWYNDTIESHAFVLRTLQEITPEDTKHVDGLVLWLFLNKKFNQWKSTRTTSEVIYSLAYTLKKQKALCVREAAKIAVGSVKREFVFEPDRYSGDKAQVLIPASDISPAMAKTEVSKTGPGYLFASVTWHYSTEKLPAEARGDFLAVTRRYFLRKHKGEEYTLSPIAEGAEIEVGDQVEVHLSIRAKHPMEYIHLRDPRGAGFEPESQVSGHRWDLGISWYEEVRDSGMNFFFEWLPQGEYTFKYRIRANMAGKFRVGPATIQSMYAPEFAGFSDGALLEVK